MTPWSALEALARGAPAGEVSLVHAEHVLGMTGRATWLIVAGDGLVTERTMRMGRPPEGAELGRLPPAELRALAAVLVAQRLDQIAASEAGGDLQAAMNQKTQVSVRAGEAELEVEMSTPAAAARADMQAIKAAFERARALASAPPAAGASAPTTVSVSTAEVSSQPAGPLRGVSTLFIVQTVLGLLFVLVVLLRKLFS
ncbi:MAG: hypothetical protein AB7N76_28530 [Planctomycetota bacterium]